MTSDFLFPQSDTPDSDEVCDPKIVMAGDTPVSRLINRYAELVLRKGELKKEMDEIDAQTKEMQPRMMSFFNSIGNRKLPLDHVTLFIRRDLRARAKFQGDQARQEVCDALRHSGMGQYVHDAYDSDALSGWVRELETLHKSDLASGKIADLADLLPPPLQLVLNVAPSWSVQGRRRGR